jgi:phosphatidylethanolamine-binding protein (PEBP) family uncharacterized protein
MRRLVFAATLCLVLAGALPARAELPVDFAFTAADKCSTRSPEIRIGRPPAGTARLAVRLKDFDAPLFNHGGGTVPYDGGNVIPAGALKDNYFGPCPPEGSHTYEFSVRALDAAGKELDLGRKARRFP